MSNTTTLVAALENAPGVIIPLIREVASTVPEATAQPRRNGPLMNTLVISLPVMRHSSHAST